MESLSSSRRKERTAATRDEDQLMAQRSLTATEDRQVVRSKRARLLLSLPLAVAASRQLCSVLQALAQSVSYPSLMSALTVSSSAGAAESCDEGAACLLSRYADCCTRFALTSAALPFPPAAAASLTNAAAAPPFHTQGCNIKVKIAD